MDFSEFKRSAWSIYTGLQEGGGRERGGGGVKGEGELIQLVNHLARDHPLQRQDSIKSCQRARRSNYSSNEIMSLSFWNSCPFAVAPEMSGGSVGSVCLSVSSYYSIAKSMLGVCSAE